MHSQFLFLSVIVTVVTTVGTTSTQSHLRSGVDAKMCEWRFNYRSSKYDNTCDAEYTTETEAESPIFPTKSKPTARRKATKPSGKTVDVNFVLINKGIDYKQKDDVQNTLQEVKIPVNCVLLVSKNNQCYGWQTGPPGRYVNRPPFIPPSPPPPPPFPVFIHHPEMAAPIMPIMQMPIEEERESPVAFFANMFLRQMAPHRRRAAKKFKKGS